MNSDLQVFERERPKLLALAYRMLGEMSKAEDIVQDAWLRWQRRRQLEVQTPQAYLVKIVTRLCLNELDTARARREEARGDRLPEPIALKDAGLVQVEALDRISMALVVLLQRLTPLERAVLLLHEVFDLAHVEIAELVGRSEDACRQLLKRARAHVSSQRRSFEVSRAVQERLLAAFMRAASRGDIEGLSALLADDVVLIADAGPEGGTFGRARNLPGPLAGACKVAAFVAAITPQGSSGLTAESCELNGQPSALVRRGGAPLAAIMISVVNGKIASVFVQADRVKLRFTEVGTH